MTHARFDAPFRGLVLASVLLVGALGCIALSFVAQEAAHDELTAMR